MSSDEQPLPLAGIKVVDFGQYIAGPYCAAILAAFGADVVRIERIEGGTDRDLVPLAADRSGDGALYRQVNRNKRSLALDLTASDAPAVVDKLVAWSDVIVANLPPKALAAIGLAPERVAEINPSTILVTCSAYEASGPRANFVGFDGIGQALSGAMHMTGDEHAPRKTYVHYVDFCTAAMSAFGVALSLIERNRTGAGQHVSASLVRTALSIINSTLVEEAVLQPGRTGTGNRAQQAGPADVFRTRDGWILLQVAGTAMFGRWAKLVGRPELTQDPKLATDLDRGDHGVMLSGIMQDWCGERTTADCLEALRGARLPAAEVLTPAETLADPALAQPGWFDATPVGDGPAAPIATPPLDLSAVSQAAARPAPRLGEHSAEVLREIGCTDQEVRALLDARVAVDRSG